MKVVRINLKKCNIFEDLAEDRLEWLNIIHAEDRLEWLNSCSRPNMVGTRQG